MLLFCLAQSTAAYVHVYVQVLIFIVSAENIKSIGTIVRDSLKNISAARFRTEKSFLVLLAKCRHKRRTLILAKTSKKFVKTTTGLGKVKNGFFLFGLDSEY